MKILNIAGYKFTSLTSLAELRGFFLQTLRDHQIKGTILLSEEGINLNLSGEVDSVRAFQKKLPPLFKEIKFHETYSHLVAFKRTKVKIKKEIITLRKNSIDVSSKRANALDPHELKHWLDGKQDFLLLDTRNDYEIQKGQFAQAVSLNLKDFCQFPEKIDALPKEKTIVMYCTGGIRCEKAALYLQEKGFEKVWQLDGGILGYFAKVGQAHYQGKCFVFDDRETVIPEDCKT